MLRRWPAWWSPYTWGATQPVRSVGTWEPKILHAQIRSYEIWSGYITWLILDRYWILEREPEAGVDKEKNGVGSSYLMCLRKMKICPQKPAFIASVVFLHGEEQFFPPNRRKTSTPQKPLKILSVLILGWWLIDVQHIKISGKRYGGGKSLLSLSKISLPSANDIMIWDFSYAYFWISLSRVLRLIP